MSNKKTILIGNGFPKEKRERQPNWSEGEKCCLLSLTKRHREILENKCSDSETIKKKSAAWDDIALNMKAAGYHRSKERTKQQFGRMKSAEAKRARDALIKGVVNGSIHTASCLPESNEGVHKNASSRRLSGPNSNEQIYVKIEKPITIQECENLAVTRKPIPAAICQEIENLAVTRNSSQAAISQECENLAVTRKPIPVGICPECENLAVTSKPIPAGICPGCENLAVTRNSIPAEISPIVEQNPVTVEKGKSDDTQRSEQRRGLTSDQCSEETAHQPNSGQNSRRNRRKLLRSRNRPRAQVTRQLNLYRLAIERERLCALRVQRKRDKQLYQKDIKIQNLKVQILENVVRHNRGNQMNI